jgi:hypothetical protein
VARAVARSYINSCGRAGQPEHRPGASETHSGKSGDEVFYVRGAGFYRRAMHSTFARLFCGIGWASGVI